MTNEQKESLKFYTTNDYLLINGLLWNEDEKTIDEIIQIINSDGQAVMKEAIEMGYDVRWNCSKEKGEEIFKIYQKRFPVIDCEIVKEQIIARAYQDINNMMDCLTPLDKDMVLYRNIKKRFVEDLKEGAVFKCLGFSSCSIYPHFAENAMYGSSNCLLFEIEVPKYIPVIRMDLMKDIQNEEDEIILAPMQFVITKIDNTLQKVYMKYDKTLEMDDVYANRNC